MDEIVSAALAELRIDVMKKLLILAVCGAQLALAGCSALPIKASIKEGHYRLEGLNKETLQYREYLTRGCFKSPEGVRAAGGVKELPAGIDSFWVEASVSKPGVPGVRYAYVHLTGEFEEDKRYFLNRSRVGKEISIWAQEVGTENIVSNVAKTVYLPKVADENQRRKSICGQQREIMPRSQQVVTSE